MSGQGKMKPEESQKLNIEYDPKTGEYQYSGDMVISNLSELQKTIDQLPPPESKNLIIDGKNISQLDSAGAWLIWKWRNRMEEQGIHVELRNFPEREQTLLALVEEKIKLEVPQPPVETMDWVTKLGFSSTRFMHEFEDYLTFIGMMMMDFLRVMKRSTRSRLISYATVIYQNGFEALPIIALLSLMIGVVITYQMGLQLRNYGANIFIVDLLGLSILREFAPLLTAIMVAGRTGSAFTAQIGMMKLNQEIDALNTMGVTPAEVLVIPRIVGMLIVLPLLTMWANIFGVIGGMLMANNMLGISWYDFLHRFPTVIPLKTLIIGLGKTPVFALIISSIGCFEGMKVSGGAESVGRNTTRSVVLSIFFILLADAAFSVIFSKLKL